MSAPAGTRTRWGAVGALGLAMLAVTSEITVAAVALPGIGADLAVGPGATAWVLLAYTVPMAALGIPAGRWGDRADPRPVFLLAQLGIVLGTALTVLAPAFPVLIAGRVLQGVAASLVVAVYMPIVTAAVPAERRGRAISLIIMVMTVGTMAGAPAGGLVADAFGWRAVFLVKLPAVLAAVAAGAVLLDRRRVRGVPAPGRSLLAEAVLLGGALTALLVALDQGTGPAWRAPVAAAAAVALFAGWVRLPAAGAVRAMVRRPAIRATLGALFAVSMTAGLVSFLVPWFVADVLTERSASGTSIGTETSASGTSIGTETSASGTSIGTGTAAASGSALLVFVGAVAAASPVAGWLTDRYGPLRITVAGGVSTTLALAALLPLGPGTGWTGLAGGMALAGLAAGLFNPAVNAAVLAAAPPGTEGATGGIAMTARTVGSAVGPALAALGWTLTGGGGSGWRLGVGILLVAAAAGTVVVLRPALRPAAA
ncbi:MFS transporter [Pseudonocardia sp. C8]|uniref:MFS transporter n=1 Tax=Pseudonocardia sp. C8 TaxID=2762759 RepID=UPI0016435552|nr:MFS transporter [Pseudonocardia sp. C8]MBC3192005.1 MFS transporter [Pseudonocardia sp. C8]